MRLSCPSSAGRYPPHVRVCLELTSAAHRQGTENILEKKKCKWLLMSILNDEMFGLPHKMEEKGKIKIVNGNFAIFFFFSSTLPIKRYFWSFHMGFFKICRVQDVSKEHDNICIPILQVVWLRHRGGATKLFLTSILYQLCILMNSDTNEIGADWT